MFSNQMSDLEQLANANYGKFVHPGQPEPEWVRRAASHQRALADLRADARAERASRQRAERLGLLRRLVMVFSRA